MQARKNLPKTALPRIYFIDRKIASGAYPSTASLAEEYETSMSSISRDIDFMKTMLNAPIEYSPLSRGYYYTEKTWRLPAGYTTARDMLALGMAKALLALYQNTPLHAAVQELLDNLTAPMKGAKEPFWYENRIVVPQTSFGSVMPETWDLITSALRENRVITFDYRSGRDTESTRRRVRPYQLLFDASLWYLYAWAEERKAIRLFSVSRIKNATLTSDTFTLPADYDYRVEADGSYFGLFSGAKKHIFRVAFYDESGVWAGERKWAADQSVRETKNGIIITFSSVQYDKVLEWVLSRGGSARPLAPKVLVADWKRHIQMMAEKAKEGE